MVNENGDMKWKQNETRRDETKLDCQEERWKQGGKNKWVSSSCRVWAQVWTWAWIRSSSKMLAPKRVSCYDNLHNELTDKLAENIVAQSNHWIVSRQSDRWSLAAIFAILLLTSLLVRPWILSWMAMFGRKANTSCWQSQVNWIKRWATATTSTSTTFSCLNSAALCSLCSLASLWSASKRSSRS